MALLSSVIEPVREFFTLRRAESTVRAYVPAQQARVGAHFTAGEKRLSAGRRVTDAVPAAVLLREAVRHYLLAAQAARDAQADDAEIESGDLASLMPELPEDPARPGATPSDDARVRAALSARHTLYFDELSAEDVERARWALDRAATTLRRDVEARSLTNVRGTRWGRIASAVLLVGYAGVVGVRSAVAPRDIALHKPVNASSRVSKASTGSIA
jgi:hypothetical protein